MKVIVLFEVTGRVRDAFIALGHEAVSCDLKNNYSGPHIKADVKTVDLSPYDLAICHPPCTYICVSGAKHFHKAERKEKQQQAIELFLWTINIPIKHIAVENPIGIMSTLYRQPDQIIQPWDFGETESKATCLWLKNLPLLKPTKTIPKELRKQSIAKCPPGFMRSAIRSATFPGIAKAMAEQWSSPIEFQETLF